MKQMIKRLLGILLSVALLAALTACGNASGGKSDDTSLTPPATTQETQESTENTPDTESPESGDNTETDTSGSNILVAYFSLAGEQYGVGVIEEGNTSIIAHMIAEQTGADLFEIEAVTPYPESHSELLSVSRQEMSENARPAIVGTVENMADYDTVFIGYPNWWGDMPMIVYNFLESYDFSDKTVIPFCTHGGSGLSGTESTIAELTGANMLDGFAISGETAQNDRDRSRNEVDSWLNEIGMAE